MQVQLPLLHHLFAQGIRNYPVIKELQLRNSS